MSATKAEQFIAQHEYEPDDLDYGNRLRSYLNKFGVTSTTAFKDLAEPVKHTFDDGSVAWTQPSEYLEDQFVALHADEEGNPIEEADPDEEEEHPDDEDQDGDTA